MNRLMQIPDTVLLFALLALGLVGVALITTIIALEAVC
jgi:hypothetical protein